MPFYQIPTEFSHLGIVTNCTIATVGDVGISIAAFWAVAVISKSRQWFHQTNCWQVSSFILVGVVIVDGSNNYNAASGIANGARQGILFKSGAQLELIGRVRAIAFDKTGTLTIGKPEVVQVIAVAQTETQLLQVAAALESLSEHPIGEAVVKAAQKQQIEWRQAVNVQAHTGQGIIGEVDQQLAIVGKATFVKEHVSGRSDALTASAEQSEETGKTVVWVAYAGDPHEGTARQCPVRWNDQSQLLPKLVYLTTITTNHQ